MYLEPNSDPKKTVVPWYDSETSCFLMIFLMLLVFIFGLIGISVVNHSIYLNGTTWEYLWVPLLLILLSAAVMLSIGIRLTKRYVLRFQYRYLKHFSVDDFD